MCIKRRWSRGVRHPAKGGRRKSDVRTFGTTTAELLQLANRLAHGTRRHACGDGKYGGSVEAGVQHSGGQLCGDPRECPPHQSGTGRKTDVKDCEWLAQLLEHGLLRASFIPPPFIRELRDLTAIAKP